MQRVIIEGSVTSGGTTITEIIPTSDLRFNHSPAIIFMALSAEEMLSMRVRSADNNVNIMPAIYFGVDGGSDMETILFPYSAEVPWFLGPQGDGLELVVVGTHSAGSANFSAHIGVIQINNNVIVERTEQLEIP